MNNRVKVGTAHFKYITPGQEEAFQEGRRILGKPEIKEGEKLLVSKSTGQYIIEKDGPCKYS
jgi:hypothetical protein